MDVSDGRAPTAAASLTVHEDGRRPCGNWLFRISLNGRLRDAGTSGRANDGRANEASLGPAAEAAAAVNLSTSIALLSLPSSRLICSKSTVFLSKVICLVVVVVVVVVKTSGFFCISATDLVPLSFLVNLPGILQADTEKHEQFACVLARMPCVTLTCRLQLVAEAKSKFEWKICCVEFHSHVK